MTDEANHDDITIEPEESAEGGISANPADTIAKLREKLKKAIAEKQEYLDGWQRAKADFINARKRDDETKKDIVKYANEDLMLELVPVLDSFTLAFANKEAWEKVEKNWRVGVEYIYAQLKGVLEQNGFKEFEPKGEAFDPVRHTAVESVLVEDPALDHKVIEVVQKGYTFNGKIARPAHVKIGEVKK